MSHEYLGVEHVDLRSVVVPHANTEYTEILVEAAKYTTMRLNNTLFEDDVELRAETGFHPQFPDKADLPADIILFFCAQMKPDVSSKLIGLISAKRFYLLHIFLAEEVQSNWLSTIAKNNDVFLTKKDVSDLSAHPLTLTGTRRKFDSWLDDLAKKIIQKKAYEEPLT